jgi:hypothetical protein
VGLALHNADPWASRRIHKLQMELVTRYRYTAATRAWVKDEGKRWGGGVDRPEAVSEICTGGCQQHSPPPPRARGVLQI